jgi:hypothetical protein
MSMRDHHQTVHPIRFLEVDGIGKVTLEFWDNDVDWEDYRNIRVWNMSRAGVKLGLAREKAAGSGKETTWTFDNYPNIKIVIKTKSPNDELLEWLETAAARKVKAAAAGDDPLYKKHNNDNRAKETDCPVCLDPLKDDAIALVPCGHRVCPMCWGKMSARHKDKLIHKCPLCRDPILHHMPQDLFPDEQPMYSRFCVEIPLSRRL